MSYANFKPTIWSKVIQTALHEKAVLASFCNTEFEGDAKLGGKVKIIGAEAPEIYDYDQVNGLKDPETQDGAEVMLEIDQAKVFNVKVDDIDAAQMNGIKLLPILNSEASLRLAAARERHVGSIAATANNISESSQLSTTAKVKGALDAAILALREGNVEPEMEARIELPWWMYQLFKEHLVGIKTDNDKLIAKGMVGWYEGFKVVASNCLHNDGTDDYAMIRTKKAIALASDIEKVEAYRPEKFFCDAIKGLSVYGAKLVRKGELYVVRGHK